MAGYIRVSPDLMHERAMQMRKEADRMDEVIARLDSLLNALQGEWDGAARESFTAAYQEIKPEFMTMEETIRGLAAGLDSYAARFEELDDSLA